MPRWWFKAGDDVSHSNLAQFLHRTVSVPFARYDARASSKGWGGGRERERERELIETEDRQRVRNRIKCIVVKRIKFLELYIYGSNR